MAAFEIKKFEDLILPTLPKKSKLLNVQTHRLTAAGDNYGSLLFGVKFTVEDGAGQSRNVELVAKMLPQNEFIQRMFNAQRTFRNEVSFYKTIAPALRNLQQEMGWTKLLNSYPGFVASRENLDSSSATVDENAVILIDNLKTDGFGNVDKTIGFDLDQTKLVLRKMAELHGTSLALKQQRPEQFNKLEPLFTGYKVFDGDNTARLSMINSILAWMETSELCKSNLDKIKSLLERNADRISQKNSKALQSPFLGFVHTDLWSNNIMVKIVDGKTVDVKFVDYQMYEFCSFAKDLVFFLFTSVEFEVIRLHCDELLRFYHQNLIKNLEGLKCDLRRLSFEELIEDVKKVVEWSEFFHILLMLGPIYKGAHESKTVDEISEDDMLEMRKQVSEICIKKSSFIVEEFIKRGWI